MEPAVPEEKKDCFAEGERKSRTARLETGPSASFCHALHEALLGTYPDGAFFINKQGEETK